MAEQEQKKKPTVSKTDADELAAEDAARQPAKADTAIVDETDDLLDEIDSILEEQSVLVNYKQRGGQ